jgi:hypothetical protein
MNAAVRLLLAHGSMAFTGTNLPFTFVGGERDGAVVEALRYKPEGRGTDSRWCHWNISLT